MVKLKETTGSTRKKEKGLKERYGLQARCQQSWLHSWWRASREKLMLLNKKSFFCLAMIGAGCGLEMKLGMEMETPTLALQWK
jgi:hypothetical protein